MACGLKKRCYAEQQEHVEDFCSKYVWLTRKVVSVKTGIILTQVLTSLVSLSVLHLSFCSTSPLDNYILLILALNPFSSPKVWYIIVKAKPWAWILDEAEFWFLVGWFNTSFSHTRNLLLVLKVISLEEEAYLVAHQQEML